MLVPLPCRHASTLTRGGPARWRLVHTYTTSNNANTVSRSHQSMEGRECTWDIASKQEKVAWSLANKRYHVRDVCITGVHRLFAEHRMVKKNVISSLASAPYNVPGRSYQEWYDISLRTNWTFFCTSAFFLFRSRIFSRALGCGARRKPACPLRCKCGPWSRTVARALGVQSRENWQVATWRHSE